DPLEEIFVQNTTNQITSTQNTITQSTIFQGTIFQGTVANPQTNGLEIASTQKAGFQVTQSPTAISYTTGNGSKSQVEATILVVYYTTSTAYNRFPKNISKYAVGWESFEAFPVQNDMKRYVETLCASARLRISGGALLEHDLTWDRGGEATPETICRFYYLAAQDLTCKDPPLPTKTERILFWCHDTDVGALWNMLQSRDMLPMNAHGVSQFNCNIFYALGREICGGETDEYNTAWVLYNTTRSAKNLAGLVVGGKAWGSLRKHYGGSFETARAATQEDQVLKDSNPKAFCVSRNRYTASTTSRSSNLRSHPPLPGSSSTSTYEQPTSSLEEDDEHYDANLVFKSTLRRGMEEYGLRPLSHGRFTGVILTRNVAETVLLSQIQKTKRLREDNIDVDAIVEAVYKSKNLKPPDKVKEATNFVTPLVEEIFLAMKPWTQSKNYGKTSEQQDNHVAQRMQELEEEAAKYKQRLKSAGVEATPTKDPPAKRRRTQRGDRKKQYEKLIEEPFNVIKQTGQPPPTSMMSIKTWVTNLKKTMPADKHKELDQHIQQVQNLLDEGKYTKVQLQEMATRLAKTSFCYIGSTNLTVAKREYNRVAKLKQLQQLNLPKTEIAIRYWHDKQNYEHFSTLLLSQHQEYIDTWAEEHCLNQRWQPKLNYPFVTTELVKKAHGSVPARQQPHLQKPPDTLAKQLFKKIRRRLQLQGQQQQLLNTLPKQAQSTPSPATPSRNTMHPVSLELRSGKHDNETVTLLYRLANHMEQPWRSKARARLRRVLTFRNATVPKYNMPLKIPFLAHNDFKRNVEFITKLIRQHRHVLTPYHLPTKTIQEMPHPALNKVLWNHMCQVTTQGRHWKPEPCKCKEFLQEHPRAEHHEGHVATGLETLEFRKGQSNLGDVFANIGACNAFFPSKRRLHEQKLNQLRGWLRHHLFPNDDPIMDSFTSFFEEQWTRHKEQQRQEPRLTHRLIKHLVSSLPRSYIIHNEDHANAHLMIYCPNVYNQAAFNTWMDKKMFLLLDKSPDNVKADMERQTPAAGRKNYKKLLDYNKPIPYGYIMMKRKKQLAASFALPQWHFNSKSTRSIKSNMTKFNAQHIVDIIQFSFDVCAFTAIGEVFRQTCGTSMGSQISPILSTYVDNRAIIVDKDENCDDFLGFNINATTDRSATFFIRDRGDTDYLSQQ
ncbi:tauD, partial [Symbiodinium sp. KB8]